MTNDRYDVTDLDRLQNADVVDTSGDRIGRVGQIYVDDQTGQPTFATVHTGLFGAKESFVPLHQAQIGDGTITVPYSKDVVKGAPNVDADGHLSENEQDDIYRYYQEGGAGYREGFVGDPTLRDRDTARQNGTYVADQNWDRDRVDTTRTADLGDNTMVRREEELHVGTERVETGRVRLRKHVVTEQKTVTVPVQREEFEVVREPIADGRASTGTLGEDEQVVTLTEERPVVEKQVVDKERVGLQTNVVTDQQQVSAQVGREEIEVDNSGVTGNRVTGDRVTDGTYVDDNNRGESLVDKAKDHLRGDHDHDGTKDKYEN